MYIGLTFCFKHTHAPVGSVRLLEDFEAAVVVVGAARQVVGVFEQQRQAATEPLMSGIETDLRTAIDRAPDNLAPYLDLARLYAAAQRPVDAEAVLMSAIAVLKKSTGR